MCLLYLRSQTADSGRTAQIYSIYNEERRLYPYDLQPSRPCGDACKREAVGDPSGCLQTCTSNLAARTTFHTAWTS